jgi:hypothetical protein
MLILVLYRAGCGMLGERKVVCGIGKLTLASFTSFPLRRFVLKTEDLCYTAIYVYKSNKFLKHQSVQPNIRCTSTYCKQCTGGSVSDPDIQLPVARRWLILQKSICI